MSACINTYVEKRAPQLHPSWQIPAPDKFMEKRRQKQASKQALEKTRSFKAVVSAFAKNTKHKDLAKFNVNRQFGWEDVKSVAADAVERDNEKTRWRHNAFRAAGRSLQQSASNLEMLLAFLPNGDFTGILCGALTLVFSAASRLDEVRGKILSCLDSLPNIVGQTQAYVDIYDEDPEVWKAAEDLYLGILEGVEGMLLWIDKSAFERAVKAFFSPATVGKDVEEISIRRNIEDKVTQFREVVQVGLHKRFRLMGEGQQATNALIMQLVGQLADVKWRLENPRVITVSKPMLYVTFNELRSFINYDPHRVQNDVEIAMIDAQNVCPPQLIKHAMSVLRNYKFSLWLQDEKSEILYINGRMQLKAEQEETSPLTILSCVLSRLVAGDATHCSSLLYLCGQHNTPHDAEAGPSGMLRCLDSQLADAVAQEDVDLTGINNAFVEGIKAQRLDELCSLFQILLSAAAKTVRVVFVIVDGVSWMEEGPFAEGFGRVVSFLRDLVSELNRRRPGLFLKVLFTNPCTSLYGSQWLPEECVLEMEDVEDDFDIPIAQLGF